MAAAVKVVYVVETLQLSGGVKDIVEQAEGLARRGHDVSIVTREAKHAWIDVGVPVTVVPAFDGTTIPEADVHVATWFPTVVPTVRARKAPKVFHFTQGYEALYPNTFDRLEEIEEAYQQPIPKLLLSENLAAQFAGRFPGRLHVLGPAIRVSLYTPRDPHRTARRDPPTVFVVGPFGFSIKGVDVALKAVRALREAGREIRLLRASQLPLTGEETALCPAERYAFEASVSEMVRTYHESDLLIHGSYPQEGLGLPPFEAMAAGTPVVMTDIPSLRLLPEDAVSRAAPGNWQGLAREAARLLDDPALWAARRHRGLELVREYDLERVLDRLEAILAAPGPG